MVWYMFSFLHSVSCARLRSSQFQLWTHPLVLVREKWERRRRRTHRIQSHSSSSSFRGAHPNISAHPSHHSYHLLIPGCPEVHRSLGKLPVTHNRRGSRLSIPWPFGYKSHGVALPERKACIVALVEVACSRETPGTIELLLSPKEVKQNKA